jgi:hypothetical protein
VVHFATLGVDIDPAALLLGGAIRVVPEGEAWLGPPNQAEPLRQPCPW